MSPAPSSGVSAGGLDVGDIVHLDFTPSAGHEMSGLRYALVISRRAFNQASGIVWVCPISQGEAAAQRAGGFLVTLMGAGTRTLGSVQVHLLRGIDARARGARRVEKVPPHILNEVLDIIATATEMAS
ncbi:MAG: type II toxin-antitoxin system PemK/MazF family toxin [Metallibacterium scheffleri]|uniref:type II toxin-antitoxin system PemK/MazF family toxin n=1 Tax=Metallibacterium scheffleri TaxID=993689 RepID=UPI0026ED8A51|nr:type II toxin-antitoxin system PemK/MazF family toxin [Metallibacterium scheffleri]MCK9367970.1 type II toxin-antitoxin system PemK/MazF family toxin [Metallibacterium scheffleri]